uniref:Uncharacterized protein n=1 Tax=Rangifer tarandus platyrhynchus TaxID=3082113 RepID=A0ACB0EMU3_RANTA|nr:unnamed protein product [Rangifer tarandus platyrhynchus]
MRRAHWLRAPQNGLSKNGCAARRPSGARARPSRPLGAYLARAPGGPAGACASPGPTAPRAAPRAPPAPPPPGASSRLAGYPHDPAARPEPFVPLGVGSSAPSVTSDTA